MDSVPAGSPITFTASVSDGGDPSVTPTFNWTVSAGTISGGQGTSTITVDTTGLPANSTVTATVDVGGFNRMCSTSESCTTSLTPLATSPNSTPAGSLVPPYSNRPGNDQAAEVAFLQGKNLQRVKDWKGAEESFRRALAMQPNNPSLLNELGYTLIQVGRLDEAYDLLIRAITRSPRDPKISSNLGLMYYRRDELETAEVYLRDALKMEPNDSTVGPVVFERLGDVLYRQGLKAEVSSEKKRSVSYFKDAQLYWKRAAQLTGDAEQKKEMERKIKDVGAKL